MSHAACRSAKRQGNGASPAKNRPVKDKKCRCVSGPRTFLPRLLSRGSYVSPEASIKRVRGRTEGVFVCSQAALRDYSSVDYLPYPVLAGVWWQLCMRYFVAEVSWRIWAPPECAWCRLPHRMPVLTAFSMCRANSPPVSVRPKATGTTTPRPASPTTTAPKSACWAGPGYVVSPKPDALPIPPMSLLRRA